MTVVDISRILFDRVENKYQPSSDSKTNFYVLRKQDCKIYRLRQRGPTTFDLQAILQKRNDSRVTSNKMMFTRYTTFEPKKGKISECVIKNITQLQFITNLYQRDACGQGFSDTRYFIHTNVGVSKSETTVQCFVYHSISVITFVILHRRKCTLTHVCVSKYHMYFWCEILQFGKSVFAYWFPTDLCVCKIISIVHYH